MTSDLVAMAGWFLVGLSGEFSLFGRIPPESKGIAILAQSDSQKYCVRRCFLDIEAYNDSEVVERIPE